MANGVPIYDDDMQKPPVGVKPGWLCATQRISELASAIQR